MVAVTGQVPRAKRGSDSHKEIDLNKMFDDICAYQAVIDTAHERGLRVAPGDVGEVVPDRVQLRREVVAFGFAFLADQFRVGKHQVTPPNVLRQL